MATPSRTHVLRQIKQLENKGCVRVGDTTRDGTLYEIVLPADVPSVVERISMATDTATDLDWYNDPTRRQQIYERDNWTSQYCGEKVNNDNVTLDHFIPRCKGGTNQKDNLRTACLTCNSVKSGKTNEEAALPLLTSIKDRQRRKNDTSSQSY